jgi:hypothetical protein
MSKKQKTGNPTLPYRLPTDIGVWTWWIVFAVFILVSLAGLISIVNLEGLWNGVLFLFLPLILGFCLLKLHPDLWISDNGICYKEYLFKKYTIAWEEILEVRTTAPANIADFVKRGQELQGAIIRMDIYHAGKESINPLSINIKPFKLSGLVMLAKTIDQKASRSKLDYGTKALKEGNPPSIFNKTNFVPFMTQLFLTCVIMMLPGIWINADIRIRYGLITAFFVFSFLVFWIYKFIWEDFLKRFFYLLYLAGCFGFLILTWRFLDNLFGYSEPMVWENVQPLVLVWTAYVVIGRGVSFIRQDKK